MKEELTILRVGTKGTFKRESFEVIGRIQYFFQEGYRNHWFILYQNGKTGWLGDWAGNYSLFKESTYTGFEPVTGRLIGETLPIGNTSLEIETLDKVKFIFWEGEVPEQGLLEKGHASIELFSPSGDMGILHVAPDGTPHAYLGEYVELTDLSLQETRLHHEWL
ncbi:hypothetical protein [Rufibacter aurantiacus]|uniref:hypothetical protein n=1 Tax=Rufibacter aurantiacus TaxID=2817374 RepID=UPI001B30103A|nr:hypothetical protein [Rufibacter aurantiacus]